MGHRRLQGATRTVESTYTVNLLISYPCITSHGAMMPINERTRDRLAFVLAVVQGPLYALVSNRMNLVYGAAGAFFFLWCALVLPCVIGLSRNFRFIVWQLAVVSVILSGLGESLGLEPFKQRAMLKVIFVFWAVGSLLSSPVPIYTLLRPMTLRNRFIFGFGIILVGVALWLGVKRITG